MAIDKRTRCISPNNTPRFGYVSDLPSDVLLAIFFILRDTDKRSEGDCSSSRWNWIAVTKVCRYWWLVALECPGLWTKIRNFRDPDKICTFLERSGEAELDIDMEINYDKIEISSLLKGSMWRARTFRFAANREYLTSIMPRLAELTHRAKDVELIYNFDSNERTLYWWLPRDLPDVIPNVQLKRLSLDTLTLPWSSSIYHGLSELRITNRLPDLRCMYTPTARQFFDALEHCPNLQHLRLENVSPLFGRFNTPELENRRLYLPHLKSITLIEFSFRICARFFTIFSIGDNVDLFVSLDNYDFRSPLPLPESMLNGRKERNTFEIILDDKSFTLKSSRLPDTSGLTLFPDTTISVLLPEINHSAYRSTLPVIPVLLEDRFWLNADEVTISFDINLYTTMDAISWGLMLDGLPKLVRTLTVKFININFYGYDIGLPEALSETNSEGQMRLPELEQLVVCYADLTSEFVPRRRDVFIELVERRNKCAVRACKVSVSRLQTSYCCRGGT